MNRRKYNIPKNVLIEKYCVEKLSTYKIAKIFNCSHSTIRDLLKNYKIPIRNLSMALSGNLNPMFGNHHNIKTKNIISLKNKNKHFSPETEFKKGIRNSIKTEFVLGKRANKKGEFKKGNIPKSPFTTEKLHKIWKNPKHKIMMSKISKQRFKDMNYKNNWLKKSRKSSHQSPNKTEYFLFLIVKSLLKNKYKFVGDGTFILYGFNPDFVNKKDKKIIELYGDYWHNKPDCIIRDKRRLKTYTKEGYKTLIVWEHELKNLDMVIAKIMEFDNEK